jgi:ribonuclease P protein component
MVLICGSPGMSTGRRARISSGTAPTSREINEADVPAEQPAAETHTRLSGSHEHGSRASGIETSACQRPQTAHSRGSTEAAILTRSDRSLPRSRRIRKRAEYLKLQRSGQRRVCRSFVVITGIAGRQGSRIGITASRRTGGAVVRNRIKRLVREFFRVHRRSLMPERDVLVIARPQAASLSFYDVKNELGSVLNIDVDQ